MAINKTTLYSTGLGESVFDGKGGLLVNGSVIYVDTIADLQALPTSRLVDGQQVHVKDKGLYYYDLATDTFYVQATTTQSGATLPASGIIGQLFIVEPNDLYYFSNGAWEFVPKQSGLDAAVTDANAAADRAETARDAAQLSAGIYTDTSTGLAATNEGDYFSVPSATESDSLILYRHDAGPVATEVTRYPSAQRVADVGAEARAADLLAGRALNSAPALKRIPRGPSGRQFAIARGGKVLLEFDPHGRLVGDVSDAKLDRMLTTPRGQLDARWGIAIGDRLIAHIDGDGKWISDHDHPEFAEAVLAQEVAGAVYVYDDSGYRQLTPAGSNWHAPVVHDRDVIRALSDVSTGSLAPHTLLLDGSVIPEKPVLVQLLVTGQSLSLGSRGFRVDENGDFEFEQGTYGHVLSSQDSRHGDNCVMFDRPVASPRVYTGGSSTQVADLTTLVPLREAFDGNVLGETLCSGFANGLNDTIQERARKKMRLLSCVSGIGGSKYAGLKKGTQTYFSLMNSVEAANQIAAAEGWQHIVPLVMCVHAESEGGTTQAEYLAHLREWRDDYQLDIVAVTGQVTPPFFALDQMNSFLEGSYPSALAQLQFAEEDADAVMTGPKYQYRYYDAAHMEGLGYLKQGEYLARAYRYAMRGEKWNPLRPSAVDHDGAQTITITFRVPYGQLAIDTTTVTDPGNYGFEITDTGVSITDVSLVGSDQVVITLDGTPAGGSEIRYASQLSLGNTPGNTTGARGNVRDTDDRDFSAWDGALLYNWLVTFSKPLNWTEA